MFNNRHLKSNALCLFVFLLGGCATDNSRFYWGDYETALYKYYKSPDARGKYQDALEAAIDRGEAEGKLAPGLYAELGYLMLEQGDEPMAVVYFEKEMVAFPEAGVFLTRILDNMEEHQNINGDSPVADKSSPLKESVGS